MEKRSGKIQVGFKGFFKFLDFAPTLIYVEANEDKNTEQTSWRVSVNLSFRKDLSRYHPS